MDNNPTQPQEPQESNNKSEMEASDITTEANGSSSGLPTVNPKSDPSVKDADLSQGDSRDSSNSAPETENAKTQPSEEEASTDINDPSPKAEEDEANSDVPSPLPESKVVVSTDDTEAAKPELNATQVGGDQSASVSSSKIAEPKKKARALYFGLAFLVIVVLAVGGYLLLRSQTKNNQATVVIKKDIPDLKVDMLPNSLPNTFYPGIVDESNVVVVNMQMFEGLTKFEDGSTIVPDLAVSWTNPNSSTWVFKLRPDVHFHTGRIMTATDVVDSINAVQSSSWGQEFASTIKTVQAINPLTVQITTNGPDPLMLNELTGLYIFDTTSGKTDNPINGTGPYNLASSTANDITLTAFNEYWGGHVYTRKLEILGYSADSAIPTSLLKSRQIQVMSVPTDPVFAKTLKSYGYNESNQSDYAVGQLGIDTRNPSSPLSNEAVRKALAMAVNKTALINASNNTGDPVANQIISPGVPGYNPSISATPYSVTKAKADLAAAGYPNGFSFQFTYYDTPANQALATEFQKQMEAIGVTVNFNPISDANTFGDIVVEGTTDMYYGVLSSDYVDGSDIMSFFVNSPYNNDPTLNQLSTEASKTLDQSKRVQLLQQMNSIISSKQDSIPLFVRSSQVLAVAPNIVINHDTNAVQIMGTYFYHDYQK